MTHLVGTLSGLRRRAPPTRHTARARIGTERPHASPGLDPDGPPCSQRRRSECTIAGRRPGFCGGPKPAKPSRLHGELAVPVRDSSALTAGRAKAPEAESLTPRHPLTICGSSQRLSSRSMRLARFESSSARWCVPIRSTYWCAIQCRRAARCCSASARASVSAATCRSLRLDLTAVAYPRELAVSANLCS